MTKRPGKIAFWGLILAGIGYILGILTAPKSGKQTRKTIQNKSIKAKRRAEKKLKVAHGELSKLVEKAKSEINKSSTKTKAEVNKAVEAGQQAKEKVRIMLSAVHEGGSDNKDLQNAISEANKAITNLKKFITKRSEKK